MMNTKYKFARLVISATFGSLIWAGCASERTYYADASAEVRPINLTERRADMHPEWRTGAESNAGWEGSVVVQETSSLNEAAGAERFR